MLKLKILNTSSCVAIFIIFKGFELFNNINQIDPSFTQLDTKEQVNILLYGYPLNKSNALNQDIIKFVISFLKKYGRFDKPLILTLILCMTIFLYAYMLIVCYIFVFVFVTK